MKRRPLLIKKEILKILKQKETVSIKQLERKVSTNYQTILNNCEELAYFGFITIEETKEHTMNGREYLIARITDQGRKHR